MDTLDSHLAALHSNPSHSPAEMLALLKKQNETLISLAAQLQGVHEAVKSQKEQYLTYRRVFHGDAKNVFRLGSTIDFSFFVFVNLPNFKAFKHSSNEVRYAKLYFLNRVHDSIS